jgi:ATP-dependent Lon protease
MTGEVTLLGRVPAIGKLKEKLLAAHRAGVRKVLMPQETLDARANLPPALGRAPAIALVARVEPVLEHALVAPLPAVAPDESQAPEPPARPGCTRSRAGHDPSSSHPKRPGPAAAAP